MFRDSLIFRIISLNMSLFYLFYIFFYIFLYLFSYLSYLFPIWVNTLTMIHKINLWLHPKQYLFSFLRHPQCSFSHISHFAHQQPTPLTVCQLSFQYHSRARKWNCSAEVATTLCIRCMISRGSWSMPVIRLHRAM